MAAVTQGELEVMLTRLSVNAERFDMNATRYMQGEQRACDKAKAQGIAYSIAFLVDYFDLDVPGEWNLIGGRGNPALI